MESNCMKLKLNSVVFKIDLMAIVFQLYNYYTSYNAYRKVE